MKYCIITNDDNEYDNPEDYVGFYQWLHVFGGQVFNAEEKLPILKDGEFDVIHVRLCRKNASLVSEIRKILGTESKTKIVVSLDIPVERWKKELPQRKSIHEAAQNADFVFGTEFSICRVLEKETGKKVYELSHPADIDRIRAYIPKEEILGKEQAVVINILYKHGMQGLRTAGALSGKLGLKLRVIFYKERNPKLIRRLSKKRIDPVICGSEEEFCKAVAEGNAFISPYDSSNYGKWYIYAAAMGALSCGCGNEDAARRCYPTMFKNARKLKEQIQNLNGLIYYEKSGDHGFTKFLRESAFHKVEYYNWGNSCSRFLHLLSRETGDQALTNLIDRTNIKTEGPDFVRDIVLQQGTEDLDLAKNEMAVVCLLKDGMEHLEAFLRHYEKIGAKHFIFVDNGSTDGTLEFLDGKENVTLYTTNLKHSLYESEIRRTVIQKLFRDTWCLCVDIDEFFDYPYSERIDLKDFLEYMNQNSYTAVISYMLDMFSRGAGTEDAPKRDLTEKYCYYDNTDIQKDGYYNHNANFCSYNRLADKTMKYYYGGVRREYFGKDISKYILIKHPLMFIDHRIEPVTDPHFCDKASVADVSCLLKHYKFTDLFKKNLSRKKNSYGFYGMNEHEGYFKTLQEKGDIDFYTVNSKKLESVNDLLASGFIKASKKYENYTVGRKAAVLDT